MSDEPSVPRRKKSRRNLRRITVPGDEVPRGSAFEEDVDLDGDDLPVDDEGSDEDDDSGFEDEPTDPSVFDKERGSGQRTAVESRASFVPQEGSSFRNEGVVVSRSRIISDRPAPSVLLPPPTLPSYPPMDVDEPVVEQVSINAEEEDEEESRPTLHAEPPSAPVRSKTPPPPPPGQSIMIATDYAQEVDDLRLRREAEDLLPPSLRPSAVGSPPSTSVRPSKAPKPASLAPPRDTATPAAILASNPPQPARPSSTWFPEHTTGPRASAAPAVPVDARPVAPRAKPETSAKPNPPAPPRKILTPVPPSANKPPPPPPKEPGAKRPPAWWKTFFSDDYLRSVLPLTPAQVRRQCDFLEAVLGLPRGATILDVGCGTGLQAIEMTERGYLVVGLDLSLPMITRAAEEAQYRNLRINFLHTDIREIQFEGAFDAVVCLGTTFGFFDDDSNRNVLGRLRDALKPGGRLLLDVVNRDYVIRSQPNLVWFQGDGCVCMEESDFNYFTSRLHVKRTMMHEDGRQSDAEYSIRLYSLHEIGQLLNPLGFRVIEVSGQHATRGVFFGTDSSQIIALAERRLPKADADGGKTEPRASGQKTSLRPVPPVVKPEPVVAKKDRDSSDDLTELVEEESAPSVRANAFDDEEATDPNVRMPEPSGPTDE